MKDYEFFRVKPIDISDKIVLSKLDFDKLLKYELKFFENRENETRMFKSLVKLVLYYKELAKEKENIEITDNFLKKLLDLYNFKLEFVKFGNKETIIGTDLKK